MAVTFISACSRCGKRMQVRKDQQATPTCHRCRGIERVPYGSRKLPLPPRPCELCEKAYKPYGPPQRFCSKTCATAWQNGARPPYTPRFAGDSTTRHLAKSRARNLRRAQTWDGITDAEIYERDGWRCQVPGCKRRPIRKDLKNPHPRSKSVDHIIPLLHGGDDTAVNKRAAHLRCNIVRSANMGDEQLALFGSLRDAPLIPGMSGEGPVRRPRVCECGAPAAPGHRRCEECWKRRRAEAWHRSNVRYRAAHPYQPKVQLPKKCVECGEEFTPASWLQAACGEECGRTRKRRIDRERRWIDPVYRARAIATSKRNREKHAVRTIGGQSGLWAS